MNNDTHPQRVSPKQAPKDLLKAFDEDLYNNLHGGSSYMWIARVISTISVIIFLLILVRC